MRTGAGKSTYCHAMQQFLSLLKRKVVVVNLDPANETMLYSCDIDIRDLIQIEDVMLHKKLGPNGAMLYCMEFLNKNIEWLESKLQDHKESYILIDCPGQIELYVHDQNMQQIIDHLTNPSGLDCRLVCLNLVDSHHCTDIGKYISVLLTSLSSMLHIALPHINVLSKIDVIEKFGELAFGLEFYTDVLDLNYLVDHLQVIDVLL